MEQRKDRAALAKLVLDIAKPGRMGWADRHRGPFGIMADDVIAGIATALVLYGAGPWL